MAPTDAPEEISPEDKGGGFDYCFWSKLLVAIVLFPLVAFIVASFFACVACKIVAAAAAIAAIIYAAIKIDQVPCLMVKIPALIGKRPSA